LGLRAYLFGKSSEDLACEFLLKNGCEILDRNFNSKFGEIDVVAKKDGVLRFTEIKATQGDYEAEYRLTPAKFNKISSFHTDLLEAKIDFFLAVFDLEAARSRPFPQKPARSETRAGSLARLAY